MAYTASRQYICYQRFLIAFFIFMSLCIYAHTKQPAANRITFNANNDTFFITEELYIDITVSNSEKAPYIFTLEEDAEYTELIKSDSTDAYGQIAMHYVYRFKKTGNPTFNPRVKLGKTENALPPFSITIHPAPLSEHTAFTWEISPVEQAQRITESQTLIQGEPYILFLTARFFSPQQHAPSDALHSLPPELTRITCSCPENAVLEPYTPTEAAITAVLEPETSVLAAFHWIPLYTGTQLLPQAQILFANGRSTASAAMTKSILPAEKHTAVPTEPLITHPAFLKMANQDNPNASNAAQDETAQKKQALTIAQYRFKELHSLFPYAIRTERKKQEALLAIANPLPLYPPLFAIACVVSALLGAIAAVTFLIKRKKVLSTLFGTVSCLCGIGGIALRLHMTSPKGICIESPLKAAVHQIPDHSGRVIHQLLLGESVYVLQQTPQWYYIRTTAGVSGWVPQHILAIYNQKEE